MERAIGGQVLGAYYPNMDPSGSSSGSGVASSKTVSQYSQDLEVWSILEPSNEYALWHSMIFSGRIQQQYEMMIR